jgi:hypothetical protein
MAHRSLRFVRASQDLNQVFVFKNGKGSHRNKVQLGQYGRYRTNVWSYAAVNFFSRTTEEGMSRQTAP